MKLSDIAPLVKLLDKSSLTEISYSAEGVNLVLKKEIPAMPVQSAQMQWMPPQVSAAPMSATGPAEPAQPVQVPDDGLVEITSPMVGTYYASPSPGASPFVTVGHSVRTGQALCIVEAMKLMNEIESEVSGVIEEICVSNGSPVEFGTVLFRVKPA